MSDNPRSLPRAPNSETVAPRLSTSTLRQRLKDETYAAIGKTPFPWQLDVAEALCNRKDVLCIAGTGKGKTLAFVMPYFVDPRALIFRDWKLPACAVNATTSYPGLHKVCRLPERLLEYNKLRPIIIQLGAANWNNIVIVDECHCMRISTAWDPILCGNGDCNPFDAGAGSIIAPVPEGIRIRQRGVLEAEFILLLQELTHTSRLPVTIIFVDQRKLGFDILKMLLECLPEEFADQIEIYHALQSQLAKDIIAEMFEKGLIRILICTTL